MKPLVGVDGQAKVSRAVSVDAPSRVGSAVLRVAEKKICDDFRAGWDEALRQAPTSRAHFVVHAGMDELQAYAKAKGWTDAGYTQLSIPWQQLVFTTDSWKTTQTLKSADVPSPVLNGFFDISNVPKGTTVEFAIHVGVASHAPADIAGYRERGDLWLNNGGRNFTHVSQ
jgi:hypothetical protein